MKYLLCLLVVIVSLTQSGTSIPVAGQSPCNCRAGEPNKEVNRLQTVIRDESARTSDPERVFKAIEQLGDLKAVEAVDELTKLLSFKREIKDEDVGGIVTEYRRYPAVAALYKIGECSLPALVRVIENEPGNSIESKNAYFTMLILDRENSANSAKCLRGAARKAATREGFERLIKAAEKLEAHRRKVQPPPN